MYSCKGSLHYNIVLLSTVQARLMTTLYEDAVDNVEEQVETQHRIDKCAEQLAVQMAQASGPGTEKKVARLRSDLQRHNINLQSLQASLDILVGHEQRPRPANSNNWIGKLLWNHKLTTTLCGQLAEVA